MNDPHVVALLYRVDHGKLVDYSEAEQLVHDESAFRLEVKDNQVRFELKDHYASEENARNAVENYIRNWESDACLEKGPDSFRLNFDRSEIIDRNPTPGVINLRATITAGPPTYSVTLTIGLRSYPSPPLGINYEDPNVQSMYQRYMGYRRREEPLMGMVYFCLTVLEHSTGERKKRREAAARKYRIEISVLRKIAYLSSERGGAGARKATGVDTELTPQERCFLEQAVKKMIRRAAEMAHDPDKVLPKISLLELPQI